MAEATGLRNNALPYPIYAQPWGVTFPILDADGDLVTGATGLDSEVSKNGDTFADCTNEATEIATSSGTYYLLLTASEMTADAVTVIVKTTSSGAKTTVLTFYPRKLVTLRTGTAAGGAAGSITLDSGASAEDDFYNGCVVAGVLDSTNEVRVITDYTGSTKVASVTPNWNTTPDSDDTFTVYLPEGRQLNQANVTHIAGSTVSTSTAQLGVNVVNAAGTAWNSGAIGASTLAADTITDAKVASDVTIASVTGAVGSVTGNVGGNVVGSVGSVAAGGITASSIADGAIDAATFAADVDAEILSYLVDDATRIDASALNTLSSHDPGETIMGATDLGTGSGLTSLATAAELAKVPKSDSNVTWNATALASIQSEAEDALIAHNLDHLVKSAVDTDFATTVHVDSVVGQLAQTADGGYSRASDSLEAIRDRGDSAWITATGFSTHSAADVWAVGARTLTAATNITSTGGTITVSSGKVTVGTNDDKTGYALSATGADAVLVAGETLPDAIKWIGAVCAGVVSGAGTGTEVFKDFAGSTVVTVTVDSSGNRSAVVLA